MNRRIINAALIFVLLVGLVVVASQVISGTHQVTNPAASPFDFGDENVKFLFLPEMSQTLLFVVLAGFTVVSLVGFTVVLVGLFYLLNREVKTVEEEEPQPTNPLSYDTYGHYAGAALVIGLSVVMAVFLLGTGILPEQASDEAGQIDTLFTIVFVLIALIFGLVAGLFIHFLIYYRARPGDTSDGVFIHGNTRLEILWTVIPTLIVIVLGVIAALWLSDISRAEEGEIAVEVTARQWGWQFAYPLEVIPEDMREPGQGAFISSELVMRQDQPYLFEMTSVDVIHSFWVPEMRVKRDVVPGVITELRMTPTLAGDYKLRCAELCGAGHWSMVAPVRVVDEAGYRDWVESTLARQSNPVLVGEDLYSAKGCSGCHSIDGSRVVGPTWQGLYGEEVTFEDGTTAVADETYIRNSILDPNSAIVESFPAGVMPQNFSEQLSAVEVDQLVDYIKSLSDTGVEELQAEGILDAEGNPVQGGGADAGAVPTDSGE
jgi:cytochrome c oxidase subunit 2